MYVEATQPGSSRPNTDVFRSDVPGGVGGVVFPNIANIIPREIPAFGGMSRRVPVSNVSQPPRASDGDTGSYPAAITRRVDLGAPSVVSTLFQATPANNVVTIVRDLPNAAGRPLFPLGLTERVVEALPAGMKARAANWSRLLSRLASKRPSLPVARE